MATWYAQADANTDAANQWNSAANGSGSFLTWGNLGASDVLDANNHTTELNVASFTCDSLVNSSAGGGFTCDRTAGANRTFTCDITAGAVVCLTCSGSTYTLTIVGNVTGGTAANAYGINPVTSNSLTITGNVTGGSNGSAYGISRGASAGTLTISGNVTGGTGSAIQVGYHATATISGNMIAVNDGPAVKIYSSYFTVLLDGNLVCSADGTFPVYGIYKLKLTGTTGGATQQYRDGSLNLLTCKVPDYPTEAQVESGVDFDYTAKTGTLAGGGGLLTHPGMGGGARG